jgi:transposase, IS6 family
MIKPRPALFKWRHFEPEIIVRAVRWYLRFSLSYRDVEELLLERSLPVDHTTIWRWVQRYAPELKKRCRRELKPTNGSWRVDETYICQGGSWRYLYRAVDSTGATIDFWFSAERDAAAAKQFFQKALQAPGHPRPRVITVDGNPSYPKVIAELKEQPSPKTLYSWAGRGRIPYVRIEGMILFPTKQIIDWLRERNYRPGPSRNGGSNPMH